MHRKHVWKTVNDDRGDDSFSLPDSVHTQKQLGLLEWFGNATEANKGVLMMVLYHMCHVVSKK